MSGPLLSATGVSRRFGSLLAVDGVDLEVGAGEVVGLVGANGAGKTTLIRMLLGLLHPSAGQVRLLGEPPSRRTRARLGYVSQGLGLYEDLTVAENLAFAAQAFGGQPSHGGAAQRPSGEPPDPLHGPLDDPDLEAARGELVAGLPLGLRRRLAFAAALGHQPELLVLDEPTSGVDALGRARLWDAIRSAAEGSGEPRGGAPGGRGHGVGEAEQCDRLVVMAAGRVAARGTVEEIIGDATTVAVQGATWEDAFAACEAAGLRAVLEAAGVTAEVRVTRATLEEAFVLLAVRAAA